LRVVEICFLDEKSSSSQTAYPGASASGSEAEATSTRTFLIERRQTRHAVETETETEMLRAPKSKPPEKQNARPFDRAFEA